MKSPKLNRELINFERRKEQHSKRAKVNMSLGGFRKRKINIKKFVENPTNFWDETISKTTTWNQSVAHLAYHLEAWDFTEDERIRLHKRAFVHLHQIYSESGSSVNEKKEEEKKTVKKNS